MTPSPLTQLQPLSNVAPPTIQPPPVAWAPATDLIVRANRQLRQTLQHQDIKNCISKAVDQATVNLYFVNAFPDLKTRNLWLGNSLAQELTNRSNSNLFLREVNACAEQDNTYFGQLFSMVGRHCAFSMLQLKNFHSLKAGGALLTRALPKRQENTQNLDSAEMKHPK